MNMLLIFLTPIAMSEPVCTWKSQLTAQDHLFIMSLNYSNLRQIDGCDIHFLEIDPTKSRYKHPMLLRVIRHCPSLVCLLWSIVLQEIWADFLWNIRSFDPDVIDLRWMPNSRTLGDKLSAELNQILVLSEGDIPPLEAVDTSWRSYAPNVKVSIVLPVYNGARYLHQSINSCLQQSHQNIELVIVDDCSTDETPDIIAEYAKQEPRIISIRNQRNLGLPGALNVGFAHTTGELLTWTSHDNYYAPNAVEMLVRYLCTWQDIDFVYSAYYIIDSEGRVNPNVKYLPPLWQLPFQNTVGPYFLYRRVIHEKVGEYLKEMEYLEDYDYWVRVYKAGFNMMRLHVPLYYYRYHPESLTARLVHRGMGDELWGKVRRKHFSGR